MSGSCGNLLRKDCRSWNHFRTWTCRDGPIWHRCCFGLQLGSRKRSSGALGGRSGRNRLVEKSSCGTLALLRHWLSAFEEDWRSCHVRLDSVALARFSLALKCLDERLTLSTGHCQRLTQGLKATAARIHGWTAVLASEAYSNLKARLDIICRLCAISPVLPRM